MNTKRNKSIAIATVVALLALGQAGCGSMSRTQTGTLIGAATGAAAGSLIGSKKGHTGRGALIGGAAGALTGGVIGNYMDRQAEELASVAEVQRVEDGIIVTMRDKILFQSGQSSLQPASQTSLTRIAAVLKKYQKTEVTVAGHTDHVGTATFNQSLSDQRARSVYRFLGDQGISSHRMKTMGFGFSQPVSSNETASGRAQNRRVELHISPDASLVRDAEASASR